MEKLSCLKVAFLSFLSLVLFMSQPSSAEQCGTFDSSKNVAHLPCLNLGSTSYWVEMGLVPTGLQLTAYGTNAAPGCASECASLDSAGTFHIPCIDVLGGKYWLDLQPANGGSVLNLTNFGSYSAAGSECTAATEPAAGSLEYAKSMVVGAWAYGGRLCDKDPDPMAKPYYFLCPGGGLKGVEKWLNPSAKMNFARELDYVAQGSYSITKYSTDPGTEKYAKLSLNYKTKINIDGVYSEDTGLLGSHMFYDHEHDRIMFYYHSCWFGLVRLADGKNKDIDDSYCGSSSHTTDQCGTDADCGRCWYCDTSSSPNICRYGGEGPYGCYRGWEPTK